MGTGELALERLRQFFVAHSHRLRDTFATSYGLGREGFVKAS
jgi:hypothetical protein